MDAGLLAEHPVSSDRADAVGRHHFEYKLSQFIVDLAVGRRGRRHPSVDMVHSQDVHDRRVRRGLDGVLDHVVSRLYIFAVARPQSIAAPWRARVTVMSTVELNFL